MMNIAKLLIFCVLLVSFFACGKKTEESDPNRGTPPRNEQDDDPNPPVDVGVIMKDQKLVCENPSTCPGAIAKIVISARDGVRNCTGTLIDNEHILTASSCLPKNMRTVNIECGNSTFFVFAETKNEKAEIVGCDRVVYADRNTFNGDRYPEIWPNDKAILKLKLPIKRSPLSIYRKGITKRSHRLWKVDTMTDKVGVLKSTKCTILRNSYVNPLSDDPFSSMQTVKDCELVEGNRGAPLINSRQEILGVYSLEMAEEHYNFLENSGLLDIEIGSFYHFSNASCMQLNPFHSFGVAIPDECTKRKTMDMVDNLRSRFMRDNGLHKRSMERIERQLERPLKYFKWDYDFIPFNLGRSFQAYIKKPKCIYRSDLWYKEFSRVRRRRRIWQATANITVNHKLYIFHTKFDENLRPISVMDDGQTKSYEVSFTPRSAHREGITNVAMTSVLFGAVYNTEFPEIEKCD